MSGKCGAAASRLKIRQCGRCPKRTRNPQGWNVEMIAGIEAGYLCPDCQTVEEDLEAELNLITGRSTPGITFVIRGPADLTQEVLGVLVDQLATVYPTSGIMRTKADRLAVARGDRFWMVKLMRMVADGMESGDLFEG